MHKKYIEPSFPMCVDYIPEDLQLCAKCIFWEICPFDYCCKTLTRLQEYEEMRDGEKTVKGEE